MYIHVLYNYNHYCYQCMLPDLHLEKIIKVHSTDLQKESTPQKWSVLYDDCITYQSWQLVMWYYNSYWYCCSLGSLLNLLHSLVNSCTLQTLLVVMEDSSDEGALSVVCVSFFLEAPWTTEFHGWFLFESSNSLRSSGARCDALTISLYA